MIIGINCFAVAIHCEKPALLLTVLCRLLITSCCMGDQHILHSDRTGQHGEMGLISVWVYVQVIAITSILQGS